MSKGHFERNVPWAPSSTHRSDGETEGTSSGVHYNAELVPTDADLKIPTPPSLDYTSRETPDPFSIAPLGVGCKELEEARVWENYCYLLG